LSLLLKLELFDETYADMPNQNQIFDFLVKKIKNKRKEVKDEGKEVGRRKGSRMKEKK